MTLEDILEEIVGEFKAANGDASTEIIRRQDNSFIIQGQTSVRDVNKNLDWELPIDEAKTINGLILEELGSFPKAGDKVQIDEYEFNILNVRANTISMVKARKLT